MTISLYDATVPSFLQHLRALDGIVAKAQVWAAEQGMAEADLLARRIADDMVPLSVQIKWTRHHSLHAIEGVRAGAFQPDKGPAPETFPAHRENLASAIAALEALDSSEVNGFVGSNVHFSIPNTSFALDFTAENFLFSFSLPNFFFHVTTAYDLFRGAGLPIGKRDYLGAMRFKATP